MSDPTSWTPAQVRSRIFELQHERRRAALADAGPAPPITVPADIPQQPGTVRAIALSGITRRPPIAIRPAQLVRR